MVAHRKIVPPPQANVPSSWLIVLTVLVVIGGAGWLGWLLVDDDPASTDTTAASTASGTEPSATASPDASPTPDAATDEPSTDEPSTDEPSTDAPSSEAPSATTRSATVSVLNNSGIVGAARTFSVKVAEAGWTLGGIGNWTGSIPGNTVYYPEGQQAQAELLARDVGIDRVRPRVAPMRADRLTIILSATP